MKKITSLTTEQEAAMAIYRDKWIKIGLSTEPTDEARAFKNIVELYKAADLAAPERIVFADSPFHAQVLASNLEELMDRAPTADISVKTFNVKKTVFTNDYIGGNMWAGSQGFVDYFDQVLKVPNLEKFRPRIALSQDVSWIFPYDKLVILVKKAKEIHLNEAGRLHNETGKCIVFPDGWGFYSLNGVRVPEYIVLTPADKLDPKKVLSETNTEIVIQGVKKIGPKILVEKLGAKCKDKVTHAAGGKYRLLSVDWTGRERLYLEMINPSTNEVTIEPVHPDCKTIDQALGYREQELFGDEWSKKDYKFIPPTKWT